MVDECRNALIDNHLTLLTTFYSFSCPYKANKTTVSKYSYIAMTIISIAPFRDKITREKSHTWYKYKQSTTHFPAHLQWRLLYQTNSASWYRKRQVPHPFQPNICKNCSSPRDLANVFSKLCKLDCVAK